MPNRTISEARYVLAQAEGLSDDQRRQFESELKAAEGEAHRTATEMASGRVQAVAAIREDALADLCGIRDDLSALIKEAGAGPRVADYERKLSALQAELRAASRRVNEVEAALAYVERVEADPVAYTEGIYETYPLIRPTFSF